MKRKIILPAIMILIGLVGIAFSAPPIVKHYTVPSEGHVHTIGINAYNDPNYTAPCTLIDWGWLNPGEETTRTIYLYNDGNVPLTLSAITLNWQPVEAPSYLTFTWNSENVLVDADHGVPAVLTLSVALGIQNTTISDFSFDIQISGTY